MCERRARDKYKWQRHPDMPGAYLSSDDQYVLIHQKNSGWTIVETKANDAGIYPVVDGPFLDPTHCGVPAHIAEGAAVHCGGAALSSQLPGFELIELIGLLADPEM